MRKSVSIMLILLLFSCYLCNAQKRKAKIILVKEKNGLVLNGYAKILDNGNIIYRETKGQQPKELKNGFIKRVEIYEGKQIGNYEFLTNTEDEESKIIVKEIVVGPLTVYKRSSIQSTTPGGNYFSANGSLNLQAGYQIIDYYIKEKESDEIEFFTSFTGHGKIKDRFISLASAYFYDCPDLIKKIKALDFEYDLDKIAEYYNDNCSDK